MSANEVLAYADLLLGGLPEPAPITPSDFYVALAIVDDAFVDGAVSTETLANGETFTPSSYLSVPLSATPGVPEPSTWTMLSIAFAGLGLASRRVSRRNKVA